MMLNKRIIYQPLKSDALRRFAHEVGALLAQQQNDEKYVDPTVIDGLADFLIIVNDLLVKRLNAQSDQGAP